MATVPEQPLVPISKRIVLINSISSIAARVLTAGVFLWAIQYLIKRVPQDELALLPIVGSLAVLLPLIQTVLTAGLARHVTEAYARNDMAGVTRIVSSQFPLLLAGSGLLLFVGGIVTINIEHILTIPNSLVDEMQIMLAMVLGRLALGMVLAPFNTGLFAKQQFVRQNAMEVLGSLVRAFLTLALVLGIGPRVVFLIMAQVISQVFTIAATTLMSVRGLPALRFHRASFDWPTSKRSISFGAWQFVVQLAAFIRRATDPPILNELSSAVEVNNFFLGSAVESQLRDLSNRTTQPLVPALVGMHSLDQHSRIANAYLRSGRIALWGSMFFAAPLIVFSHEVFAAYLGSRYEENAAAATVMILLLLGFPLTYPTKIFFSIAQATDNLRPVAIRVILAQAANLVLTLILVGLFHLGAVGSAASTLFTFAILYPWFMWPLANHSLNVTWHRFLSQCIWPGMLPTAASMIAGWMAVQPLGPSPVLRLLVGVPVCLATYLVTMAFVLQPADRADLKVVRKLLRV